MPKKPKFKPEITRVKLNPEQAVLACACYTGVGFGPVGNAFFGFYCFSVGGKKSDTVGYRSPNSGAIS